MPILDHFHPPLGVQRMWHAFHHAWAATMARYLNRHALPEAYFAAPNVQFGARVEVDVGAFEASVTPQGAAEDVATMTYVADPPMLTLPALFPDTVEVVIFQQEGGPQLVAAVELVSPSNKDRPEARRTFAAKMLTYLSQGIALVVVDIVTSRTANLHNEWLDLLETQAERMPAQPLALYANAYHPIQRQGQPAIDLWVHPLCLRACLPTLPLFLRADLCIALPLEATYIETCQDQRIALP